MGNGRTPKEGSVPEKGDETLFTCFEHDARSGPALPDAEQTPWTHGGPPATAAAPAGKEQAARPPAAADSPDPVTAEDFL
jgi:hypothetical protein